MSIPAIEELVHRALDVTFPTDVEIAIDTKRNVLYIHIEGATILRINRPLVYALPRMAALPAYKRYTNEAQVIQLHAVYAPAPKCSATPSARIAYGCRT
jgi:hypothetical protein